MNIIRDDYFHKLKQMVSLFEENEMELTDAPQELIDQFGYSCLANALMFKEPEIPKYEKETIYEYIKTHKFTTVSSLCNYIVSLKNDIDKLYGIFCWAALNIQYDTDAFFSDNIKSTTLEEVFNTKKAVCSGYSVFFIEMAKLTKINTKKIKICEYSNCSKAYGFDPLNPPKYPKSDHSSIYIEIDGVQFICEPTWASGSIGDNKQFTPNFKPHYFLIPIYKSLNSHYPCDESTKLLQIKFPFKDFLKSPRLRSTTNLKTESNPLVNCECRNGFLEQIYSCNGPIDCISFTILLKTNNKFIEIPNDGIIGYQILQKKIPKHPERCRFRVNIAFPQKGLFLIEMYINNFCELEYYVNNLSKSSLSIPIDYNPWNEPKFIPILPKTILTQIKSNYAIIRFAVSPKRSEICWKIIKLFNNNSFEKNGNKIDQKCGTYATLMIPFDNERFEDQICINFPSNGRYAVEIYLSNGHHDNNNFTHFITYYFDVLGVKNNCEKKNICNFIYKERSFVPTKFFYDSNKELFVRPNTKTIVVTEKDQFIDIKTESINDKILLNLKHDGKTFFPHKIGQTTDFYSRYQFVLPNGYGEYQLLGWINDSNKASINIDIFYINEIFNITQEEINILNDLKILIEKENEEDKYLPICINSNKSNNNRLKNETVINIPNDQKTLIKDNKNDKDKTTKQNEKNEDNNINELKNKKVVNALKDPKTLINDKKEDKDKSTKKNDKIEFKNTNLASSETNATDNTTDIFKKNESKVQNKMTISIENYDPKSPLPIDDPYTIQAIKYLKIEINDIIYPNDDIILLFTNDPKRKEKVKDRLQKCVNIIIKCIKNERIKIIKEMEIDKNQENKFNETDKYLLKVIEIKNYIEKMKTYEQSRIIQKEYNNIHEDKIRKNENETEKKLEVNYFNQIQTVKQRRVENQDLTPIINMNREILIQNELNLNDKLVKYIYRINKQIMTSKKTLKSQHNNFKRLISILGKKRPNNNQLLKVNKIPQRSNSAITQKSQKT